MGTLFLALVALGCGPGGGADDAPSDRADATPSDPAPLDTRDTAEAEDTAVVDTASPGGPPYSVRDADTTYFGEAREDAAGFGLASGCDLSGDGVDDLAVGAFNSSRGASQGGAAYVVFGPLPAGTWDLGVADVTVLGVDVRELVGRGVSCAGDVNADGHEDLFVAAAHEPGGGASVFFGPLVASAVATTMSAGDVRLVTTDTPGAGYTGVPGVRAGDVNGDGVDDLLVTDPLYLDPASASSPGGVYLLYGPLHAGDVDLSTADATLVGPQGDNTQQQAGSAAASVGDVDGDGDGDLLVGAPNAGTWGAAYLVLDAPVGATYLEAGAHAQLRGDPDAGWFGAATAGGGDLDGDGAPDFAVGAPYGGNWDDLSGTAFVFYGVPAGDAPAADVADAVVVGAEATDEAGAGLAIDDLTDDGVADLVLTAACADDTDPAGDDEGALYVLPGPILGTVDLADHVPVYGQRPVGDLGRLAPPVTGDYDADGQRDVVVTSPLHPGLAGPAPVAEAGAIWMLSGVHW